MHITLTGLNHTELGRWDKYSIYNKAGTVFINNKYSKLYYQIIENARVTPHTGYTERHHIIPRCMGGSNRRDNLVALSARQHFLCHLLLTKMVDDSPYLSKLKYSAILLSVTRGIRINSRTYARLREGIKQTPEWVRKRTAPRGYKHSAETKLQLSLKAKDRIIIKVTCVTCKKTMDYMNYCKSHGDKCGLHQGPAWNTGKTMSTKGRTLPKQQCEFCLKMVDAGNYTRWHGKKCKHYE